MPRNLNEIVRSWIRLLFTTESVIYFTSLFSGIPITVRYVIVLYTQSSDCHFLPNIPSWWKGDTRPAHFTKSTITYKVVLYDQAERTDTLPLLLLFPYMYSVVVHCTVTVDSFIHIRGLQRDVDYLGWPIAALYMSPNARVGGELRGLGQWVQLYTGTQINFGDLL